MALDERHRLARERVGQVAGLGGRLAAAHHRIERVLLGLLLAFDRSLGDLVDARLVDGRVVELGAVQEAEELVEAAHHRVLRRRRTEMPLADDPARVPARLQVGGEQDLGDRRAEALRLAALDAVGVELVAEALLIAAGHERGARRAADRGGDVPTGEPDAARRQRVEVRRGAAGVAVSVGADVADAEVVGENDDDVRGPIGGFRGARSGQERERYRAGQPSRSERRIRVTSNGSPDSLAPSCCTRLTVLS